MFKDTPSCHRTHRKAAESPIITRSSNRFGSGVLGIGAVCALHRWDKVVYQLIVIIVGQSQSKAVISTVLRACVVIGRTNNNHRLNFAVCNPVIENMLHSLRFIRAAEIGILIAPTAVHKYRTLDISYFRHSHRADIRQRAFGAFGSFRRRKKIRKYRNKGLAGCPAVPPRSNSCRE